MDLNQMLIFSKVAENQSFTAAAAELNIEKSTVSAKISQLESRLGVRLLNRTTRSVTLTEAGEGYLGYCQQIVESATEAEQFVSTLSDEASGLLRVSISTDFGQLFIRKLIEPFMRENAKVELELILDNQIVDLVKNRIDVAMRIDRGLLEDSTLIAKRIFEAELGMFASPDFIKRKGKPKTFDQLENFDFVEFAAKKKISISIKEPKQNQIREFTPNGRFKVNDMLAAKEAALSGLGVVILPTVIVNDEVKNNLLEPLLEQYTYPTFNLYAVYPSRQWMPAKLKVFLSYLDHFGEN